MDFRLARRNRRLNFWAVAVLLASLALGLNYLSSWVKIGIDLTREDRYTLSQETLAWLEKLERPTDIIITIRQSTDQPKIIQRLLLDLELLLDAYERAPSPFPIRVHRIDVNARKVHSQLIEKYSLAEPNQIIIASSGDEGGRMTVFSFEDQPSTDASDQGEVFNSRESKARDAVFGSGMYADWKDGPRNVPEPTKFLGEEVILRGILGVARDQSGPNVVYFSRGHGEKSPLDMSREQGLSEIQSFFESRNLRVALLEPDPNALIPEDAILVVVASPKVPFREQEVARLRSFTSERNGNLLMLLDPLSGLSPDSPPAFGFRPLLEEWGLRCHDMLVHDPDPTKFDVFTGDYALRTYSRQSSHPVIDLIRKHGFPIYAGNCRPVEREPTPPEQVDVTELVYSSRVSWGMSNWSTRKAPFMRNELIDLPGPVPVAVVSEKKLRPRHDVDIHGGKIATFGSSRIFVNRILSNNAGNQNLLRNLLHWFLDEEDMLNVPPKEIVRYSVNMSEEDFGNLLYSMTTVPGCIALLGLFVHWLRKDA